MTTRVTIEKDSSEHNIIVRTRSPTDTKDTPIVEETINDNGGTEFLLHSGQTLHVREVEKPVAEDEGEWISESIDDEDDSGLV